MSTASLNASNSIVLALLAAVVATTAACSSADEKKSTSASSAWTCAPADVPSGQVMRCVATSDAPIAQPTGGATGGEIFVRTTPAPAGDTSSPETSGAGSEDSTAPSAPPAAEPSTQTYECAPDSSSPDCPDSSATSTPSAGSTGGASSTPGLPTECSDADMKANLPYCAGPAPAPATPPQPGKVPMTCTKDMQTGDKVCDTAPTCGAGTHPSKCGACVEDAAADDDCTSPAEGGCWVTGGGFIVPAAEHANFGGNAKQMKKGGVSGHWNHKDHASGNHLNGRPQYLFCRYATEAPKGGHWGKKGLASNQVYFGGEAKWGPGGGAPGFWFDVVAEDHGKGHQSAAKGDAPEYYHLTVRVMDDPKGQVGGAIVYDEQGPLVGGKITIHPSNNGHPGIQYPPPAWVAIEPGH